jgi:hypothetical protein
MLIKNVWQYKINRRAPVDNLLSVTFTLAIPTILGHPEKFNEEKSPLGEKMLDGQG